MELEEISAQVAAQEEAQETEVQESPATSEVKEEPKKEESLPEPEPEAELEPDPDAIIKSLPPRKKTAQERIAEMTWKQREAERERDYWKKLAEKEKEPAPQGAFKPSDRPKLENFDSTEAYEDALFDYYNKRTASTFEEKERERKHLELVRQFDTRAERIREVFDDFDEVVRGTDVITPAMQATLLTSESGPQMAYYLCRPENYKVAKRIATMPPELQPYEIGKLETRLMLAAKTKKVSEAPAPITPVKEPSASSPVDESKLSDDEWYQKEKARRYEALKKKYGG